MIPVSLPAATAEMRPAAGQQNPPSQSDSGAGADPQGGEEFSSLLQEGGAEGETPQASQEQMGRDGEATAADITIADNIVFAGPEGGEAPIARPVESKAAETPIMTAKPLPELRVLAEPALGEAKSVQLATADAQTPVQGTVALVPASAEDMIGRAPMAATPDSAGTAKPAGTMIAPLATAPAGPLAASKSPDTVVESDVVRDPGDKNVQVRAARGEQSVAALVANRTGPVAAQMAASASAQAAAPLVPVAQNFSEPGLALDTVEASKTLSDLDGLSGAPTTGPTSQTSGAASIRLVAAPPMAQQAAVQIAAAVGSGAESPIQLSLSPEELGRVRLGLLGNEGQLVVTVQAERPETLDLLRRNAAALESEFLSLGYADVQFDFGHSDGQAGSDDPEDPPAGANEALPEQMSVAPAAIPVASVRSGIDIRL